MQRRRHRMRRQQRRDSARDWVRSGAKVTVKTYARRYGVDSYTAYDDLVAIGFPLPPSAEQWARRPPATPRATAKNHPDDLVSDAYGGWTMLDGRRFFVVGYTSGGAPYGMFEHEMEPPSEPPGAQRTGCFCDRC